MARGTDSVTLTIPSGWSDQTSSWTRGNVLLSVQAPASYGLPQFHDPRMARTSAAARWQTDMTAIWSGEDGWTYPTLVTDCFCRSILG